MKGTDKRDAPEKVIGRGKREENWVVKSFLLEIIGRVVRT